MSTPEAPPPAEESTSATPPDASESVVSSWFPARLAAAVEDPDAQPGPTEPERTTAPPPVSGPTATAHPPEPPVAANPAPPRNGSGMFTPHTEPGGGGSARQAPLGAPPPALARALGLDPFELESAPTAERPLSAIEQKSPTVGRELSSAFHQRRPAGAQPTSAGPEPTAGRQQPATPPPAAAPQPSPDVDGASGAATFEVRDTAPPVLRPPTVDLGDESTWADSGLTAELPKLVDDRPPPPAEPDDFAPDTYARPEPYGISDATFAEDFGPQQSEVDLQSKTKPKRRFRYEIAGGLVLIGLVIVLLVLLLGGDPEAMPASEPVAEVPGVDPSEVNLVLAPPEDNRTKVNLSWRSSRELNFAVIVAAEGKDEPDVLMAERNHSLTIEVDPNLKYCFLVQATDGDKVYESKPVPIRGATCRK